MLLVPVRLSICIKLSQFPRKGKSKQGKQSVLLVPVFQQSSCCLPVPELVSHDAPGVEAQIHVDGVGVWLAADPGDGRQIRLTKRRHTSSRGGNRRHDARRYCVAEQMDEDDLLN